MCSVASDKSVDRGIMNLSIMDKVKILCMLHAGVSAAKVIEEFDINRLYLTSNETNHIFNYINSDVDVCEVEKL
jgi:hypothetical protein